MFTGIVEAIGFIQARKTELLAVRPQAPFRKIVLGESVAVNGVCLTVDRVKGKDLVFRLLPETARATTLGSLRPGARVNLERSLRVGDRLGGHLVLGHVDGRGKIVSRKRLGHSVTLEISLPAPFASLLVEKGPIAVDGVSLTLGSPAGRSAFTVHLVPHTLSATTLGARKAGEEVNLELDPVAKYLRAML